MRTEEDSARQLKASMLGILFSSILVKFNLLINKSYDQSIGIVLNFGNFYKSVNHYTINWINEIYYYLRVKFAFDINFFQAYIWHSLTFDTDHYKLFHFTSTICSFWMGLTMFGFRL